MRLRCYNISNWGYTMCDQNLELAARAKKIATSTFANSLDDFGLASFILPTIKAVAPGMRAAGPAVTVLESVGDAHT